MNQSIETPRTVREAGDMAHALGMPLSEFLEMLGPIPMPPAGYVLSGSENRWTGPEIVNRGWIITAAWNASTDHHSLEVWLADHQPPTYADLAPAEALQLAADLAAASKAVLEATTEENK